MLRFVHLAAMAVLLFSAFLGHRPALADECAPALIGTDDGGRLMYGRLGDDQTPESAKLTATGERIKITTEKDFPNDELAQAAIRQRIAECRSASNAKTSQ